MNNSRESLIETPHWSVELHPDQAYLGRFLVLTQGNAGILPELSSEEWNDFHGLVKKLDSGAKQAFNAQMLNWSCLMNHDASGKLKPRVRWHVRPRYDSEVDFAGQTFFDTEYGEHYSTTRRNLVESHVLQEIAEQFRKYL